MWLRVIRRMDSAAPAPRGHAPGEVGIGSHVACSHMGIAAVPAPQLLPSFLRIPSLFAMPPPILVVPSQVLVAAHFASLSIATLHL